MCIFYIENPFLLQAHIYFLLCFLLCFILSDFFEKSTSNSKIYMEKQMISIAKTIVKKYNKAKDSHFAIYNYFL